MKSINSSQNKHFIGLQANEAEEAGRTARDIEARMRKERDRGLGFDDAMDAEAIENYYRFVF